MKVVLPFKDSVISYSPNIDHFLSILENQHDLTFPWILENYIDLIIRKDDINPPVFEFRDYNNLWWTCPFIHVSRIDRKAFESFGNIENVIKGLIDNNYYVYFLVDTFYVEGYAAYERTHRPHDILLYGYDGDMVYACDYFEFKIKSKKKISFSNLINGYYNVEESADYGRGIVLFKDEDIKYNISLYQYEECYNGKYDVKKIGYNMDRKLVKHKLKIFLESPDYINNEVPTRFDYRLNYHTGFKTFEILLDAIQSNKYVIIKDIHLVYCHVYLMRERVRYLFEKTHDDILKIFEESLTFVLKQVKKTEMLALKNRIKTNSDKYIKLEYMYDAIKLYKEILQDFCNYL